MTEQPDQEQQASAWKDALEKFPKKFNYHYSNPSTSSIQSQHIVEVDFSQCTCEKCGKKGVCEEGMDVFIACLCQECYDTLWTEYVQVMTKPAESGD